MDPGAHGMAEAAELADGTVTRMGYFVANGVGDFLHSPSTEEMRRFLDEIDTTDAEHGAAWLTTEDGLSLEWNGDGRLLFSREDEDPSRHMREVSRERALELWIAVVEGRRTDVERCPWQPGTGYVRDLNRDEELRVWQLREDRAFFEVLGDERPEVPCRQAGCERGAVRQSVLCRVHHFESVKGRTCPFRE